MWFVLTGYLSRGSINRASPNIDRQYSAILACCFNLRCAQRGEAFQLAQQTHVLTGKYSRGCSRVHVVFKGENNWKRRGLKGAFCYGFDNLLENITHRLQEASSKAKFTFQNAAAYYLKCRLYMWLQRVPTPWRRFLMSWWTRVWWRVPPRRFVLSKHLIPRSGSQPEEPVCTSLPRSSLPAGPLKQPRNRYKTHWTTFHLLLPLTGNSSVFQPLSSVRSSNLSHSGSCVTEPACAYLSGMCYGMSWWSSVTGGNSYLRTGPASLVGWLRSRHWKDNWKNPGGWWCLHRNISILSFDLNIWLHIYKQECLEASSVSCRFLTGPSALIPLIHQPLVAVRCLLLLFFAHCIKNVIKSS